MAIVQGVGQFNVGRDATVVLMGPFGRVDIPNLMGFNSQQVTASLRVDRLDGVQMTAELPKGWTGTIEMERGNAAVDALFNQIEAAWLTAGVVTQATLYLYVTEPNGSQTTFQYDNVSLKYTDAGAWRGDAAVKQSISFEAGRRRIVS